MKVVTNLDHKDENVKKLKDDDEDVFKILSKSEVLPGAKSDYFLLALLSQERFTLPERIKLGIVQNHPKP